VYRGAVEGCSTTFARELVVDEERWDDTVNIFKKPIKESFRFI
jgi:hypothetical protein